jgi:hypothetical protein
MLKVSAASITKITRGKKMATWFKRPALRRSQALTTFGPGSIVDLRNGSVMMAGINFWKEDHVIEVHEPNLERVLHVGGFRTPTTTDQGDGKDLPAVIFPRWMVCPRCARLAPYEYFAGSLHRPGNLLKCPECRIQVYPARLIIACEKGHVDDFPWIEWVHHKSSREICARPILFLRARGFSSSLADLEIRCKGMNCDAHASLSGATEKDNIKFISCQGKRPWLLDKEQCGESVRPVQRGASNVYFSVQVSSISIPPWSRAVYTKLNPHWSIFRAMPDNALHSTVQALNLPMQLGIGVGDIVEAIRQRKDQEKISEDQFTEKQLRYQECRALRQASGDEEIQSDFNTVEAEVPDSLKGLISKVILVERLREVRALVGFTRINPPDPTSRLDITLVPISRVRKDWHPAVEIRGEGIYIEFKETMIQTWIKNKKIIPDRAGKLYQSYIEMCERKQWEPLRAITPRFLLVHATAHILIRQLGLESGYSSASLRERLYTFEPGELGDNPGFAGLLIYTSTPDSEGSLGGLVRQGKPDRFGPLMHKALMEASWCSSDPLCIESEGQGNDATNLAACHACLLLSETCCEEFNRFLDRGMLVGTITAPNAGFFNDYLDLYT